MSHTWSQAPKDAFVGALQAAHAEWTTRFESLNLGSLDALVAVIAQALPQFTTLQLNFLHILSQCETLVPWLLGQVPTGRCLTSQ